MPRQGLGLPDDRGRYLHCKNPIFDIQMWGGLGMPNFGILHGHSECFVVNWYMFGPLGIFCGRLVYFLPIWSEKNLATLLSSMDKIFTNMCM